MQLSWLVALWMLIFAAMAAFQILRYSTLVQEARKHGQVPNGIAQANLLQQLRKQLPEGQLLSKIRFFETGSWVAMAGLMCLFAIITYIKH